MKYLNRQFDACRDIGPHKMAILIAERQVYCTEAKLFEWQAKEAFGDKHEYSFEATYGGHLIANSFEDAEREAENRGFCETILGVLLDIFDENDKQRPKLLTPNFN